MSWSRAGRVCTLNISRPYALPPPTTQRLRPDGGGGGAGCGSAIIEVGFTEPMLCGNVPLTPYAYASMFWLCYSLSHSPSTGEGKPAEPTRRVVL